MSNSLLLIYTTEWDSMKLFSKSQVHILFYRFWSNSVYCALHTVFLFFTQPQKMWNKGVMLLSSLASTICFPDSCLSISV